MKRRIVSAFLALILVLTLVPLAASATGTPLATPSELTWGRDYDSGGSYTAVPGMISWKVNQPDQNSVYIKLYQLGTAEPVAETQGGFPPTEGSYRSVPGFITDWCDELGSGNYYFTVQSLGDGTTYTDSAVATFVPS